MAKKLSQWLVLACILIILFAVLGNIPLMSLNEGRRALVVKEMFQSGDWLLPRLNNTLYLSKPPFFYWVSMMFSWLAGQVNEWTLRLPSAASAFCVLIGLYGFAQKQFGTRVAILAVIILGSNLEFAMFARRAEIEMLLTACCFGALLSAYAFLENAQSRWLYLSYGLLGFALLTKGPVSLLFVTFPLILLWLYTNNPIFKTFLLSASGWGFCLTIALSWYVVVTIKLGPDIWGEIVRRDMVAKVSGISNTKPLLSYLGWIAVDYCLIVIAFFMKPGLSIKKYGGRADVRLLIFACLTPLIVFSLFSNKHAKYLLPIYPLIALLLALHLSNLYQNAGGMLKKIMACSALLLPVMVALFYLLIEPRVFEYRVATFLPFRDWVNTVNVKEIYMLNTLDSRLVYYADKPLVPINAAELSVKIHSGHSFILLSDSTEVKILGDHSCLLKVFSPYLKKNKSLTAFGWGNYCDAPTDSKENKFTS